MHAQPLCELACAQYRRKVPTSRVFVKVLAECFHIDIHCIQVLGKLAKDGYINHGKYRHVTLTEKGAGIARKLDKKHETIKRFFIDILGVNEETADVDACEIEHVMSDETLKKLVSYLESSPEIKKRS